MSAEVQQFTFNGSAFRALNDESGESWFSGQDVCNILGTGTNHLREYLDEDEITNIRNTDIAQNGGKAPVFISEPGLYKLIMRSRKARSQGISALGHSRGVAVHPQAWRLHDSADFG